MKFKMLFLSIILCSTFSANAQFSIGGETGLTYSVFSQSHDIFSDFQGDVGFTLGLHAQHQWKPRWLTALNLQFFQQSLKLGNNLTAVKLRSNYLHFAPQVELKLLSWLNIGTGIYGNLLLNQRYKDSSTEKFQNYQPAFKIFDNIDYGLTGGLRFSLDKFYLRTSVNQNLNSISFNVTDLDGNLLPSIKSRATTFVLGLGYLIPVKKA